MKFRYLGIGGFLAFLGVFFIFSALIGLSVPEVFVGLGILMTVAGIYISAKGARTPAFICGYCGFKTSEPDRLDEHTLTCVKYQQEHNEPSNKKSNSNENPENS